MAIFSKRSLEGYAEINHSDSPGISPEYLHRNGITNAPAVGRGQCFKSALVVCHCCQRDIILNPDRSRERAYCMVHDAYLCDECGAAQKAGALCIPFSQRFEHWVDCAAKGLPIVIDP